MRKSGFAATSTVLFLLCLMYMITYIDRVNISTAAGVFRDELKLSATDYGKIFAAFGYTYAIFQIIGGWIGDRFGPRLTLGICGSIWALSTIMTGLADGFWSLIVLRLALGFGEGATFPTATRAMSNWTRAGWRGFAQGITHSFSRLGNAAAPPLVVALIGLVSWRGSFVVIGIASLLWVIAWVWYFRDDPRDHAGISKAELAVLPAYGTGSRVQADAVPWGRLLARMMPTTIVYFCYGWTLWLYLSWLPQYFQHGHNLNLKNAAWFTAAVGIAGVLGDSAGGIVSDYLYKRTGSLATARRNVIVFSLLASLAFLVPVFIFQNVFILAACLSGAFFCLELTIGPIWSVPMDIAPKYAGTASGIMNTGSAVAAIISPIVFGMIIDATGNWELPFLGSIALLFIGALLAFRMHPDRALDAALPDIATKSVGAEKTPAR
jgi:MFS family permease